MIDGKAAELQYREQATNAAKALLEGIKDGEQGQSDELKARQRDGEDVAAARQASAERLSALAPVLAEARKAHVTAVRALGSYHRRAKP